MNSMTKNKKPEEMKRFRKRRVMIGRQGLEGLPWWLSGKESACSVETQVLSLGWEDPLEKGMATHSSILGEFYGQGAWWATVHGATKSWT